MLIELFINSMMIQLYISLSIRESE